MACTSLTLKGLAKGCKDSLGGIKEVYLANSADVTVTITDNAISAITQEQSSKFYTYQFAKNTGSMVTTMEADEAAGYIGFNTELSLQFNKLDTTNRLEFMAICLNDTVAIVKDQNDRYWFLGKDNPLSVSNGTITTGTQYNEFSGYQVTLNDIARQAPYEVTSTIFNGLTVADAPVPSA